ncbi:hypothetical protein LCGC14_0341210 [marine sediment metagenome]|uniref:Glycosyltransferase RgtA/B/C/D-like domain-containing protein n=1 Tax=marine sediment metagenome TaxID=412755 RepID=A0A0F9TJA2_9ZZZZ
MRKYWLEIIVFGVIGAVLINNLAPNITWMNTDSDGAHYVLAAKYMLVSHHTSAPLFLLLGRLFLFLPFGTEAWRMGLISVFATTGGAIFIYLIVRRLVDKRFYAMISALVFGGSALVISQSTIVETYALSTCFMLGAYYFSIKKQWLLVAVMIGLLWAVHTLFAVILWGVLLISHKELRDVILVGVTLLFLLFYLYIPISTAVNGDLGMWGNTTLSGFFQNSFGVFTMLTGGLAVVDFPKRILDTLGILGVSLGLGLVIIGVYIKRLKRRWRSSLIWLFLIPVVWFAVNLAQQTYVYMMPSIGFGAIMVGLGLSKMKKVWVVATLVVAIGLMGFNAHYFDIGRTLDTEMSAVKFYEEELPKIPDGDYFMAGGWTWAMTYLYNKEENRYIIPISIDALSSREYWVVLDDMGIKYDRNLLPLDSNMGYITKQGKMALSIIELNEGVWIAKETKPEVYQYTIELAKGNEAYIGRWIGQEVKPEWRWKPSNPYKFVSGELEVEEWHHILWVRNATGLGQMLFVIVFGIYGYGVYFVMMRLWKRKQQSK